MKSTGMDLLDVPDRKLRSMLKRQQRAAQVWSDRNGIIGRNVARERASDIAWELARRSM